MELGYQLLWTACTAVLLSFLVARLVSLILSCSNPADEVREKGFKRAFFVDPDYDDEVQHKKLLKSTIYGGEKVSKVRSSGSKKKKRVKFVDPAAKFAEIRTSNDAFVKDIAVVPSDAGKLVGVEVNAVDCGEFGHPSLVGIGRSGEKEEIKKRESEEVGKWLVDQREEGKILVGFEEDVGRGYGGVGGELGIGENVADIVDKIVRCDGFEGGEKSVDKKDREIHDIDLILGSDEVVDEQRKKKLKNSSHVYEEERRGKEFASSENDADQVQKIVECEGFEGGEKTIDKQDREDQGIDLFLGEEEVVDQRDEEAKAPSNVCRGERSCGGFDGEGMLIDEEEWEGIERSDLEKDFARAKGFVEFDGKEGRLAMAGSDVMMRLYGLQKLAMEGPCHDPQPMALKFTARAKWNAWQRLGNMSPEEAMEQYIAVLSEYVPEWMKDHSSVESKSYSFEEKFHNLADAHTSTSLDQQSVCANLCQIVQNIKDK